MIDWKIGKNRTLRIHGTGIFTYMTMVDFYGFHVGKYTSPMGDPMGDDMHLMNFVKKNISKFIKMS